MSRIGRRNSKSSLGLPSIYALSIFIFLFSTTREIIKQLISKTMYDPQHLVGVQENSNFGDPKSWLSGDHNSSPTLRPTQSQLSAHATVASTTGAGAKVHRDLFNDLVEIFPLVESLIHQKASSSFTRRGSMIYTKTPTRESLYKKMNDPKGRNASLTILAKKKREHGDRDQAKNAGNNQDADNFSVYSSRSLVSEKDIEELVTLREKVEDLQRKLLEKDELLKSAEISKNQMDAVQGKLDELNHQAAEKESLIKSAQLQLSDSKIKLADKQAALEKLQWEAMTSNRKAEKLQEDLDSLQGDISSLMLFFEGLTNNDSTRYAEDYDVKPCYLECLPDIDYFDDMDMQKMEEARQAYDAAVASAKDKQDEEFIAAAASARRHLQSLVFKSNNVSDSMAFSNGEVSRSSYGAFVH